MYLYYSWVFMLFTQISLLFTQKQACYIGDHPKKKHIIYASCTEPRWGVEVSRDDPNSVFDADVYKFGLWYHKYQQTYRRTVCGTVCLLAAGPAAISQGERRKRRRWYLKVRTGNVKLFWGFWKDVLLRWCFLIAGNILPCKPKYINVLLSKDWRKKLGSVCS